jgi:hypothetical protein
MISAIFLTGFVVAIELMLNTGTALKDPVAVVPGPHVI